MNKQSIRDQLLEMEQRTPEYEEKFRKEIKKMMEKTLTPIQRISWTLSIFFGLIFVVLFSYIAITAPQEFSFIGRMMFVLGAVYGVAWMSLGIWTLKRKSFNWVRHEKITYGLSFGFVLLMLIGMMLLGGQLEDQVVAIQMTLNGLIFFLIFGIPALFNLRINRMETTLREHLLKLELKVAELADTDRNKNKT